MSSCSTMSIRLYFPIYSGGTNWNCSSKLIIRYCSPRYLLCSSPFSLCSLYRRSLRYYRGICTLIPTILRIHSQRHMSKSSLYYYIRRSKYDLFSPTLPWSFGHTTTILRLSRCLYIMKYCILYRILHFINRCNTDSLYNLRSICL